MPCGNNSMARLTNDASSGASKLGQSKLISGKINFDAITGRIHSNGPNRDKNAHNKAIFLASRSVGTLL